MMPALRPRVAAAIGLPLLTLTAAETYHFLHWNFDDAYIVFRIAGHLASGAGWTFNPGEAHNASTSVLNTFLLGLAGRLTSDLPFAAHLLGALWLAMTGAMIAWLFWVRFGAWQGLAAGGAMVLLLAENLTWGIEIHLFFALFALFLWIEARGWTPWPVLALLTLARPDAVLVAIFRAVKGLLADRRTLIWGLAQYAVVLAPWVVFSLIRFQQIAPATLANKMWQGRSGFWGTGWIYLNGLREHLLANGSWSIAGIGLAAAGAGFLIRDRSVFLYLLAFAVAQQAAYAVLNVPPYHWYFSSLDGALLLAAAYGVACLYELAIASARVSGRSRAALSAALFVGVLVAIAGQTRIALASQARDGRDDAYRDVASRIDAAPLPPGPVAAVEVGTVAYYLEDRPMIDLVGLTSPNPEFVTGRHNGTFFRAPPAIVLLHAPVWHFERALYDDIRFRMMYDAPVVLSDLPVPMQYFVRRPGARAPSREEIDAYIRDQHGVFQLQAAGALADPRPSPDAICVLDYVNGRLAGRSAFHITPPLVGLSGWAVNRAGRGLEADLYVLLRSEHRTYALKTPRVPRPDVTRHLDDTAMEMAGFDARGGVSELPPGVYRAGVAQPWGRGFAYCEFPNPLTLDR